MGTLGEADMVKLVGHKFWSPKGVAAMHVWSGCLNERGRRYPGIYGSAGALLLGGGQEGGIRAGNKNLPYIVGLGKAAELLTSDDTWGDNVACMERMRSRLLNRLTVRLSNLVPKIFL